eukprot:TRINITY_DN2257_c0_g2_i7.p1 TRINITY_DN2257_c0_g2~~TRINITY_DN2257_c0_g2_i7.p1  ORF type:complete len:623 (+),score=204.48 TRINITY_DN2257_c0_g2_i7:1975-3843(+)
MPDLPEAAPEDMEEVNNLRQPVLIQPPHGAAAAAAAAALGAANRERNPKRRKRDGQASVGATASVCAVNMKQQEQWDYFERIAELYDKQVLCDVVLKVRGVEFRAHKSVLMGYRSFLGSLMSTDMREGRQSCIELGDTETDPELFRCLLDYMYGKTLNVELSNVARLLQVANQYQVVGLRQQLSEILMSHLNVTNSVQMYMVAEECACDDLQAAAFKKMTTSFATACKREEFAALDERQLIHILSSDCIIDCDEFVVYEAAVRWLNANATRMARASHVLSLVRFPLMDAGLLSDVIKHAPIMQRPECSALLTEAWEHKALVASGRAGFTDSARTRPRRRSCSFQNHTLLMEHSDAVSALAIVADKLVSGSWDLTIKVWDTKTWLCERTLSDHTGTVRCLLVCAGKLVTGSDDGTMKVWNPETWTLVRTLNDHNDQPVNTLVECSGRLASGADDGTIKLWNTITWACEVTVHHGDGSPLALAMCGDKLISGSDENVIKVWNTQSWTCEHVLTDHTNQVWNLLHFNGQLISGSIDCTLRVWDTDTWECVKVLDEHTSAIYAITIFDGKLISSSEDKTVRVWGPEWDCMQVLPYGSIWALTTLTKDGEDRLISGSADHSVKVWGP